MVQTKDDVPIEQMDQLFTSCWERYDLDQSIPPLPIKPSGDQH